MPDSVAAALLLAGNTLREYAVAFIEAGKALAMWVFLSAMAVDNLFTEPLASVFWWVSLACLPFFAIQAFGMAVAIRFAWRGMRGPCPSA